MRNYRRLWAVLAVGIVALVLEFGLHEARWAQWAVTAIGAVIALLMLLDMIKTLRSGSFGVDLLAITAVVATMAVGEYWAGLIVLLMLTGGDALEDYAQHKATRDLKQLLDQTPTVAHRDVNGVVTDIEAEAAAVGDTLIVKPGEVVPVDGVITAGTSLVNEASLTGESRPLEKGPGAALMSGTINGDVALTMTVRKRAADSQYQAIVRLVQESTAKPAHFVRMADRYAVPFTIVAYLIAGVAWWLSGDPVRLAQVLVVASPCPLILAAPVGMVSGMSRASRAGIIVKSGTTLEKLAVAKTIAFDKTGTITQGVLAVADVLPAGDLSTTRLLQLAASVEQQSTHILARSLTHAVAAKDLLPATAVREVTGAGVAAQVGGQAVKVGKADFAGAPTKQATTAVYVSIDDQYAGAITFADVTRPEAKQTITRLHDLGLQHAIMISGDSQTVADEVGQAVGIDRVYAHQLPADKIKVLDGLPAAQRPAVMVGDGVNDAPALALADVGIAMGAHGATAASESADAVILPDNLEKTADAVVIAQDTMRIAKEAVWIGIGICTGLMLIAAGGVIPTIVGAMFQEVVDTVTILYALRARNGRRTV
ncbi:heavy metal translocating P-type ATPase [Lacticaseibacillus nasuensis]|uniref:heavy metal translocating P-type ATPase n=1 Tax=Lacticaseibacillus nasuensis TaxID=944671 RepID=UPI0022450E68|nr:heavy metal translocating P-type ATPase [Lacticaseibacillus nasuensis]MCX2456536.1 heavy metal translocating P-type ATPase [Lacticaseibacillus nasuensis]